MTTMMIRSKDASHQSALDACLRRIDNVLDLSPRMLDRNLNNLDNLPNPFEQGDVAKFTNKHGGLGIIFFTDLGNIVLFHRPTNNDFVMSAAEALGNIIPSGGPAKIDFVEWMMNGFRVNSAQEIINDILEAHYKKLAAQNKASV